MLGRRELLRLGGFSLASSSWAEEALLQYGGAPQNLATPVEYFDRLITPTSVFFVRSHFGPPAVSPSRRLKIVGAVSEVLDLGVADLKAFPEVTLTAVLQCAGNGRALQRPRVPGVQWEHGAMGQATWTGVRLRDLLKRAGMGPDAAHVQVRGADLPPKPTVPAFVRSVPVARALDPQTLVAYRMNGEPLTHAHGAPLRLVVPGWAGDHWVKWLTEVRPQKAEAEGFYMQTAYRMPVAPVTPGTAVPPDQMRPATFFPVKSIVARPAPRCVNKVGPQEVLGVAFAGDAAIAKVEVSLDGGKTWKAARLEGEPGPGRWQVFRFAFRVDAPGTVRALARATDAHGVAQLETPAWNPSGYFWNGWHGTEWEVVS